MVVFLDFEDDSPDPFLEPFRPTDAYPLSQQQHRAGPADDGDRAQPGQEDERPNPNINGFSAILSCYPIVTQLASLLDLNTLHNLSRTCRQFRANLLEYRNQLVTQTLRCCNDQVPCEQAPPPGPADTQHQWHSAPEGRRLLSGKVGKCARDMVGECRKCGVVVCRPCGHGIRTKDQQYSLGWTWRTRYSTYLGGLGAGIGEGHEGVKCGLESACRGGHDVEHEECGTAEEITSLQRQLGGAAQTSHGVSIGSSSASAAAAASAFGGGTAVGSPHDEWSGTSFFAQEIEGIGGRRVMKVKRRVRVGAVVKEYEDERERREPYLTREKEGANRAWCAWCSRVVPSRRDARELEKWGLEDQFYGDGRRASRA
ncbi:Zinc finger FYVE/PHD-type protein [Neofusicoccum parvum]|uniref:Zinc finger FYVE/PHD-type protein n=1 Tax=Neofusicoccum parvum TaxID=310453 RepID=A0ACB5RYU3_9PEZI|nr:Zinc finger FYVE/PHD-type protein [Neofusicoccum parvum]GME32459.1 Zinc finger FYVE/PHD-type protein [Neofusicoccum parvum]